MTTEKEREPEPQIISRSSMLRGLVGFVGLTVVGLGILFAMTLRGEDLSSIPQNLGMGFLALAVLATVADSLLGALRYHVFLRRIVPGTPFSLPLRADLVGLFTGAVTPSQTGGGPGQVFMMYRGGISVPDVLAVLMVNFVATLIFFVIVGGASMWVLGNQFSSGALHMLVRWAFAAFAGGMLFMGISVTRPDLLAIPLGWIADRLEGNAATWATLMRKGANGLIRIAEQYKRSCLRCLREWPLLPVLAVFLTVILYVNKFTLAWFLIRGLGVEASYPLTLAAQAVLHFVLYVAPTPGGSGIAELSTAALMSSIVPVHLLAPFTLAFRFFLTWLPAAMGAAILAAELRPVAGSVKSTRAVATTAGLTMCLIATLGPLPATAQVQRAEPEVRIAAMPISNAAAELTSETFERRSALVLRELERGLMATSRADSLTVLSVAVDTARALVEMAPGHADAHYLYAIALGQRLELAGVREKIRMGAATRLAAETALTLDPDHAGAHHVMGRLHAATMRLGRVTRFVARRLLGATALEGASWDNAEYHFARALALEPDNPRHAMELGVLYVDTDRPAQALEALRTATTAGHVLHADSAVVDRAINMIAELNCPVCST